LSPEVGGKIVSRIEKNPFVLLQQEFSTTYKINKFVNNSPFFIQPCEIKLPPNENGHVGSFQYIPVTELVTAIAASPGFKMARQTHSGEEEILCDVHDGAALKSNEYFLNNPDAIRLGISSDELEVCNPLGASKAGFPA
jgi:hypothetical protein